MSIVQIIVLTAAMIIAGLGSYLYLTNRNVQRNLTMEIKGIVTKTEEKPVKAKDKNGKTIEGIDHLTFFRIDIDGNPYETARITRNKYSPGNEIELKCDPENMKNVEEKASVPPDGRLAGAVMMLIGIGILSYFVFAVF